MPTVTFTKKQKHFLADQFNRLRLEVKFVKRRRLNHVDVLLMLQDLPEGKGAQMFKGKKTYITAALLALLVFARGMGWLDQQQYELLLGLAGSLGLAALRAGISNSKEVSDDS